MWLENILNLLTNEEPPTFKNEKPWTWGSRQQRVRLERIARHCALLWLGDFVEIGCYAGAGTRMLAEIAREHGRRVIAIDPWRWDTQGTPKEYTSFLRNIKSYLDIVDVWRKVSQDKQIKKALAERPLCFALVDGSHIYKDLLSDIKAVSHAHVIAVDDVLWSKNLARALEDGARATNKQVVRHKLCREAYLLKKGEG